MAQSKIIQENITTVISNSSNTDFHISCLYKGVIPNNPPEIETPIFVNITQGTSYQFDSDIILDNYTDDESNTPWVIDIVETVHRGKLTIGELNIPILNNQPISWDSFELLKFTPSEDQFGASYTSMKIRIKDQGNTPRVYGDEIEIVFNVLPVNQEPTVLDNSITTQWNNTIPLLPEFFTQNYYDPEGNPLGYVVIHTLPPSGLGRLIFQGEYVQDSDLPLHVTAQELLDEDLQYEDTGEIIEGKSFPITFTVFDNIE